MPPLLDPVSNEQKYSKLASGVIIGAITPESARIWVRLYAEGAWTLVITTAPFTGDLLRLEEKSIKKFLASTPTVFIEEYTFTQETNLTHVFDVKGLKPDTRYYYAVMTNEKDQNKVYRRTEIGSDSTHYFSTVPQKIKTLTFGFYSCHDPMSANGDMGAWPHLYQQLSDVQAHFLIGGGDQVYVDTNSRSGFLDVWDWLKKNKKELLDSFRKSDKTYGNAGIERYLLNIYRWYYRVYWSVVPLREVYERFPQYMIWDDHEIMDGWGSLTKHERLEHISRFFEECDTAENQILVDAMWRAARTAYYEYEHSHNPATPIDLNNPNKCQWDYSFKQGDSAFYVLDMRGHYDIEKNTQIDPYVILGKEQFDRFSRWLNGKDTKNANALFIVSSVPIVHWREGMVNAFDFGSNKDDFMDEWGHESHHWERNALLESVFKAISNSGKTVVFLSGDVHCASVFRMKHQNFPAAKVFQVNSSAISRKPAPVLSKLGIFSGGKIGGNDQIFCEKLYAMAGNKNFALFKVKTTDAGLPDIALDLCWPSDVNTENSATSEQNELTRKRINLT